ncbi:carbohydrate binding family 9 domain-containing protein [Acidobacteria bacterium AH-259-D05]|nr:carbohydrate binding family 9 domain-containing protein [Acidobacteria bacterium AH-259-D05]
MQPSLLDTLSAHYRSRIFSLPLLFLFLSYGNAQEGEATLPDGNSTYAVTAAYSEEPIVTDGVLDEAAWKKAVPATQFVQSEPQEGVSSTEKTEVRILYDQSNLYFGIYCYDSESDRVIAKDLEQDFNWNDNDVFIITIDPFNDDRNGFHFAINPAGAKSESQFFNEGAEINDDWEGVWYVGSKLNGDGWSAEISIPLKTLRFPEKELQTWGINFERRIKRKNEISTWAPIPRRYDSSHVSMAGDLLGLEEIEPGQNLKVKPYALTRLDKARSTSPDWDLDLGVDVKYGLTPGLTLDLTANTDFSHVEVDDQQINLTRFSLFFPEKRDFFLENSGIFVFGEGSRELSTRGRRSAQRDLILFFSRRIGLSQDRQPLPILGGARLTGKIGSYRLGFLNLQTRKSGDTPVHNFTVARVRRDIFSFSDIGAMFLNRHSEVENDFNRVFGLDANFWFWNKLKISSFLTKAESPEVRDENWAGNVVVRWRDPVLDAGFSHFDIGANFNNEMGFAPRKGIKIFEPNVGIRLRLEGNSLIRQFFPHTRIRHITDQENRTVTKYQHFDWTVQFHGGGQISVVRNFYFERLDEPFRIRPGIVIPVGDYRWQETNISLSSNRGQTLSGNIGFSRSGFWSGKRNEISLGVDFKPTATFSLSVGGSRADVELAEGSFITNLIRTRLNYSFSTTMFLNALIQYNSDTKQVSSNIRFNLIHRPLSDIFFVYNESRDAFAGGEEDRAIIVKYTHLVDF